MLGLATDAVISCLNIRTSMGLTMYDVLYRMYNPLAFDLIEKLTLIGLDPTPQPDYRRWPTSGYSIGPVNPIPPSVAEYARISSVLCLVALLSHKFINLDFDRTLELVEVLVLEYWL